MSQEAKAPLIDMGNAPEVFCAELARIERFGSNARFSFCVPQISPIGGFERTVNFRLIFPVEAVGPAIELTLITLGSGLIVPVTKFVARALLH